MVATVCCAVAISGHAAATPKSVTNARRLIVAPEAKLRVSYLKKAVHRKGAFNNTSADKALGLAASFEQSKRAA